eukprot:scaffold55381_cov45-Phaeocystis_antarctica.AAC.2
MPLTTLPRERATTRFLSVADDIRGLRVEAKQHDAIRRGAICVHSIPPALGRRDQFTPTRRAAKKRRNLGSDGVVSSRNRMLPLLLQAPPQRGAVAQGCRTGSSPCPRLTWTSFGSIAPRTRFGSVTHRRGGRRARRPSHPPRPVPGALLPSRCSSRTFSGCCRSSCHRWGCLGCT